MEAWGSASGIWFGLAPVLLIMVLVVVIVAAVASAARGGGVDKPNRVPQLYGYAVCLIAVVTFLFSAAAFVSSLVDLSNPLHAASGFEPAVSSFEAYKATYGRDRRFAPGFDASPYCSGPQQWRAGSGRIRGFAGCRLTRNCC